MVIEFESLKAAVLKKENLQEIMTKHPFYEIEPFFAEHQNEYPEEGGISLLCEKGEDFNPEIHDYYTLKVDVKSKKLHFRTAHLGSDVSFETLFQYDQLCLKSLEIYKKDNIKRPAKLSYLFFKDGLPDLYLQCSAYGFIWKEYTRTNQRLSGYTLKNIHNQFATNVAFHYTRNGELDVIRESDSRNRVVKILYKRPERNDHIDDVLKTIEDYLVDKISRQILQKVKLSEQVYCIVLEYCMQEAFPPSVSIGVTSDHSGDAGLNEKYNAPAMRYYTEEETLDINLREEKLQYAYLFYNRAYAYKKYRGELFYYWEKKVKEVYLNVCKRLMRVDFSSSFGRTDDFLVLANDYDSRNLQEFYEEMLDYKSEMDNQNYSSLSNVRF